MRRPSNAGDDKKASNVSARRPSNVSDPSSPRLATARRPSNVSDGQSGSRPNNAIDEQKTLAPITASDFQQKSSRKGGSSNLQKTRRPTNVSDLQIARRMSTGSDGPASPKSPASPSSPHVEGQKARRTNNANLHKGRRPSNVSDLQILRHLSNGSEGPASPRSPLADGQKPRRANNATSSQKKRRPSNVSDLQITRRLSHESDGPASPQSPDAVDGQKGRRPSNAGNLQKGRRPSNVSDGAKVVRATGSATVQKAHRPSNLSNASRNSGDPGRAPFSPPRTCDRTPPDQKRVKKEGGTKSPTRGKTEESESQCSIEQIDTARDSMGKRKDGEKAAGKSIPTEKVDPSEAGTNEPSPAAGLKEQRQEPCGKSTEQTENSTQPEDASVAIATEVSTPENAKSVQEDGPRPSERANATGQTVHLKSVAASAQSPLSCHTPRNPMADAPTPQSADKFSKGDSDQRSASCSRKPTKLMGSQRSTDEVWKRFSRHSNNLDLGTMPSLRSFCAPPNRRSDLVKMVVGLHPAHRISESKGTNGQLEISPIAALDLPVDLADTSLKSTMELHLTPDDCIMVIGDIDNCMASTRFSVNLNRATMTVRDKWVIIADRGVTMDFESMESLGSTVMTGLSESKKPGDEYEKMKSRSSLKGAMPPSGSPAYRRSMFRQTEAKGDSPDSKRAALGTSCAKTATTATSSAASTIPSPDQRSHQTPVASCEDRSAQKNCLLSPRESKGGQSGRGLGTEETTANIGFTTYDAESSLQLITFDHLDCRQGTLWVLTTDCPDELVRTLRFTGVVRPDGYRDYVNKNPDINGARGSSASVVQVVDAKSDKTYALKLLDLRATEEHKETSYHIALREARLIRSCSGSPNIIQMIDLIVMPNKQWGLVMEFCRLGTLHTLVQKKGTMPFADALSVIRSLLNALAFLMEISLVHRDVKMDNILLDPNSRNSQGDGLAEPKLCDFGLAAFEWEAEQMKRRCGTPGYVAPEIVCGHTYGCHADVFSAAVCLYRMVCGQLPFRGDTIRDILKATVAGSFSPPARLGELANHRAWRVITALGHPKKRSRPNAMEAYRYVGTVLREISGTESESSRSPRGPMTPVSHSIDLTAILAHRTRHSTSSAPSPANDFGRARSSLQCDSLVVHEEPACNHSMSMRSSVRRSMRVFSLFSIFSTSSTKSTNGQRVRPLNVMPRSTQSCPDEPPSPTVAPQITTKPPRTPRARKFLPKSIKHGMSVVTCKFTRGLRAVNRVLSRTMSNSDSSRVCAMGEIPLARVPTITVEGP